MAKYDDQYVMKQLGMSVTTDEARNLMQQARDWYNTTPQHDMVAWYEQQPDDQKPDIKDPFDEDRLADDWKDIMIARRAIAIGHLR